MMNRILFALKEARRHRKPLRKMVGQGVASLNDVDFIALHKKGIKVLVLDFDGVLASHGQTQIDKSVHEVIQRAQTLIDHVVILSNKPMQKRIVAFNKLFPAIDFHVATRKKPYPDGLLEITEKYGVTPSEMILVDDRLLTGGLATILANTQCIYINKPLTNLKKHPIKESFFQFLRWFERLF